MNSFEQYFRVTANPARDAKVSDQTLNRLFTYRKLFQVVNARLGLETPSKKRKISGEMFSRSISENGVKVMANEYEFYRNFNLVSDLQSGDCKKLNRRLGEFS